MSGECESCGHHTTECSCVPVSFEIALLMDCFYTQFIAFSEVFIKNFCKDEVLEQRKKIYLARRTILNSMQAKLKHSYRDLELDSDDK